MEQKYIIALELSGSQVKGAAASTAANSFGMPYPTIECIATADNVNCVKYGRLQNLIEAATHINFVLQKLGNEAKLDGGSIVGAYVGVSGRSLGSMSKEGMVNLPHEMEITEEILQHVMMDAIKTVPGDKKVLEVVPRRFTVDNQVIPNPVGVLGTTVKGEFTVVTCNPSNRRSLELLFSDRIQLPVRKFVVTPLAVGRLVLGDEEKALGCVLIDMGAQTTTISIYKDRSLQYLATLPMGSANITHDIALGTNTTDERAEQLKITQGNPMPDGNAAADGSRINFYVQARVGEIIANIMAQIGFAGYKAADLSAGFIITGRGSKLRNFDKCLEAQTKMRVRRASIPAIVNVGVADANDYASLVAIANAAAKYDLETCVEFENRPDEYAEPVHEHEQAAPVQDDDDDDTWMLDDDEVERQRKKAEKRAANEAQRNAENLAKQRRRAEERAAAEAKRESRRAEQRDVTDSLDSDDDDDKGGKKGGFVGKIGKRLMNLLSYNEETDDTQLD